MTLGFVKQQRGFTIIELMIVVVIIGVLAAVAIPMFAQHMAHAKSSEAMLQLNKIAIDAKTYYFANTKYPQGTANVLPGADGTACATSDRKFAVTTAWTTDPIWLALGFEIVDSNLFSYHWTSSATNLATATAVGDLDCDGVKITYQLNLDAKQEPAATYNIPPATAD